jgi:ABC-type sugar transport system permease subunit
MKRHLYNQSSILFFVLPALIIFSLFIIYPLIPSIIISFQKHNGFRAFGFIGLKNYIYIFTDKGFWEANLHNVYIVAAQLLLGMPISFLLAAFLFYQDKLTKRFFRVSSLFPIIVTVTIICQLWIGIYQPDWGLLNIILRAFGLERLTHAWLNESGTALGAVTFVFLWQYIGFNMILFYAGLKSIPEKYYDAAEIAGLNRFQKTWYIQIPLMQDVFKFVVVLSVLGCMAQFEHVKILTNGGPGTASRTLIYYLYHMGFARSDYGKGSAVAVYFAIVGILLAAMINKYFAKNKTEFI